MQREERREWEVRELRFSLNISKVQYQIILVDYKKNDIQNVIIVTQYTFIL